MEHDKLRILRKALTIVCFVLFFTTAGLIMIKSQIKTVVLDYYGYVQEINTLSANVENFFIENKIAFNLDDHVEPSMTSSIENGTVIKISSNVEMAKIDTDKIINEYSPSIAKLEEVVEDIPFQEENVDNANLEKGKTNIIQEGKLGKKSIKYIVRYENNKEIKRDEIGTNIIEQAENKVVEVGTKVVLASRSKEVQAMAAQSVPEGFKQYNIALPLEQQQYAYKVSQKYGIEYELFLAIMYRESSYNPNCIGGGNSYGLCQIHISNQSSLKQVLGVSNFLDPYDNMTAGAYLFANYLGSAKKLLSGENAIVYALNAYNMGERIYYNNFYSKGVLDRAYSNNVIATRNKLISTGSV